MGNHFGSLAMIAVVVIGSGTFIAAIVFCLPDEVRRARELTGEYRIVDPDPTTAPMDVAALLAKAPPELDVVGSAPAVARPALPDGLAPVETVGTAPAARQASRSHRPPPSAGVGLAGRLPRVPAMRWWRQRPAR